MRLTFLGLFFFAGLGVAEDLRTNFQQHAPYTEQTDIRADEVMVYGAGDFARRADAWKERGYTIGFMTGIAWGGYDAYFIKDGVLQTDEIQADKNGKLLMHGGSTTIGYNVPTQGYIDFLKRYVEPVVDYGVSTLYLEEPEYWVRSGWSPAFKAAWEKFYHESWIPPDSSPDAQWRASRLKYELYFDACSQVMKHAKARAAAQGKPLRCGVATHSLLNYAQWRIVSPESHLLDIPECDAIIAQTWTGTARTFTFYLGKGKERTFESAYFEYGQMANMVSAVGKEMWALQDPVEDNPNRSWEDYKRNYVATLVAALQWPGIYQYEVMPWPDRIFQGQYRLTDADPKEQRVPLPQTYATELLTIINALADMRQPDTELLTRNPRVGVVVSDTRMFQRGQPQSSDPSLGHFHALALPLLKNGVAVEPVQLEHVDKPGYLDGFRLLILSYEGQKPLKPEYHVALDAWVRAGGLLLYLGKGEDPYHHAHAWWNGDGASEAKPFEHLFARLGITRTAYNEPEAVGSGWTRVYAEQPWRMAEQEFGAREVLRLVEELLGKRGETLSYGDTVGIRRGPYWALARMDDTFNAAEREWSGPFIDLLDATLPIVSGKKLQPGERAFLYELARAPKGPKVLACAARVSNEAPTANGLAFTAAGPINTTARARVSLPAAPSSVTSEPAVPVEQAWDPASKTVVLTWQNSAREIRFQVAF